MTSHLVYFSTCGLSDLTRIRLASVAADLDSTFSIDTPYSSTINPMEGFFNFFVMLHPSSSVLNIRAIATNMLDQKFYRMFATASLQQRICAN
jgi:hypothetical protein